MTGITALGHFLSGSPDLPAFFYATIFTDGLAGLAILAFVIASARAPAPTATASASAP